MIDNDRGEFIRNKNGYKKIMNKFSSITTKDFFIMQFLLIFHYKNLNLKKKIRTMEKIVNY